MDCRRVAEEELVEKYVSGKLHSPLQDEFEIHFLECTTCAAMVEMYEELQTALFARQTQIPLWH